MLNIENNFRFVDANTFIWAIDSRKKNIQTSPKKSVGWGIHLLLNAE